MNIVNDKMSDTPETDARTYVPLLGASTVPAEFARRLERERDEARQWKKEMLLIESQWDEQIVGRILGLKLGDYIKPNIEPKLRQLIRERDEAREALKHIEEYGTEEINAAVDLRQKLASALVERDEVQKAVNGLCKHLGVSPANTTLLAVDVLRIQREREEAITRRMETIMQCELYEQERDEALEELRQWQTLRMWGGTPEHIHNFIKGQQTRIYEAQNIERTCEQLESQRDEAREQVKELIYIAGRAIDLAEIDFENDKFGVVSELRDGLEKIKEETK